MIAGDRNRPVRYGLIGAGQFGRFCLDAYRSLDAVERVAVADADPAAAREAAEGAGVEACASVDAMLARDDVELVHVATPPWTHGEVSMRAIEAGKHVLCEKPIAIDLAEAGAMLEAAAARDRVLSVNLVMRYDPICEAVKRIVEEGLLGEPLHGFFMNEAKDEPLPPDHWFWNRRFSGGVFVEHGVHFFDLFEWWLGEGEVVAAQHVRRPGSGIIEQDHAVVRYGGADEPGVGALVSFQHAFTQAARMDRQEMRIVFERGEVRLDEWVPTSMTVDCLADNDTVEALESAVPHALVERLAAFDGEDRVVTSRHKTYEVDGRYHIAGRVGMDKGALYGEVLRRLLADQVEAMNDPAHVRRVSDKDAYRSLERAANATALADDAERNNAT